MAKPQDQQPNPTPPGPTPNFGNILVPGSTDWWTEVRKGNIAGHNVATTVGFNPAVGTDWVDVNPQGDRNWQLQAFTPIRVKAGNANDTALGLGAREVTVAGLSGSMQPIQSVIATNGASPSLPAAGAFRRINAAWVSAVGQYAGTSAADVVIERGDGTADLVTIPAGLPLGLEGKDYSKQGNLTCSANRVMFFLGVLVQMDANKEMSVRARFMPGADIGAAPYEPIYEAGLWEGITDPQPFSPTAPIGPIPIKSDIWIEAKMAQGTGSVSASFEVLLVDEDLVAATFGDFATRF